VLVRLSRTALPIVMLGLLLAPDVAVLGKTETSGCCGSSRCCCTRGASCARTDGARLVRTCRCGDTASHAPTHVSVKVVFNEDDPSASDPGTVVKTPPTPIPDFWLTGPEPPPPRYIRGLFGS
jgi:hypothetical protein